MKHAILLIFAFIFFNSVWTREPFQDASKRLIIICGASCSGKSTLSKALANAMGDEWITLDRDKLEEEGVVAERIDSLLIEKAIHHLNDGLKVIIDTQFPELLYDHLEKYHPVSVLVYAPLPVLVERDNLRRQIISRTEQQNRFARAFVLDTYVRLIKFSEVDPIDIIDQSQIDSAFFSYPIHDNTAFFLSLILKNEMASLISPAHQHNIIIKSESQSVDECILPIVALITP